MNSSTMQLLGRCGAGTQQWRHPEASSEAQNVLHWVMHPTLHHHNYMVIKIACVLCVFLLLLISMLATTVENS